LEWDCKGEVTLYHCGKDEGDGKHLDAAVITARMELTQLRILTPKIAFFIVKKTVQKDKMDIKVATSRFGIVLCGIVGCDIDAGN
jgi:hypothetical protein